MERTRNAWLRRWLVVSALIAGPTAAALSVAINVSRPSGDHRADFATMGLHPSSILAQDLLETIGFMMVLAAITHLLPARGATLGTVGAVLAVLGIVGFAFSDATGLLVVALAQLPDHDAAFRTATAITSSGVIMVASSFGFILEVLGQLGILLIIGALMRARFVRVWLLGPVLAGMVLNAAVGTMTATLIADVLLLATGVRIAVAVAKSSRVVAYDNPGCTTGYSLPHEDNAISVPPAG